MQINLNPNDSGGNEIAFLFGAAFHDLARTIDSVPAGAIIYGLAAGVLVILFKLLAEMLGPRVRRLVQQLTQWLEGVID